MDVCIRGILCAWMYVACMGEDKCASVHIRFENRLLCQATNIPELLPDREFLVE